MWNQIMDSLTACLRLLTGSTIFSGAILIIIFLVVFNYITKEPWKRLPPGPPAFPLVGSLPYLGKDIREPLMKMANKYGDVFTIYLGSTRVVVLNGYDAIRDAFVKNGHVFSGRPPLFFIKEVTEGYGIASSQGDFWREQRRHALHVLRNFGLGRTILEDNILEEIGFFIKALRSKTDTPYFPQPLIQTSVSNVITAVTFGKRFDYEDPLFKKYLEILSHGFEMVGNSGILNLFPLLRYLPGDIFHYKKFKKGVNYMNGEYQRMIEEHKLQDNQGQEPKDFIGAFIQTMRKEQHDPDTTYTEKQLQHVIADLFGAGTETTSSTLTWSIIYMTHHPEIQKKIHAEIDDVIKLGDTPRMQHRTRLPFTEACISEVQRISDIVPLGVPHATTEDIIFRSYFLPKGTMIMANMASVHFDEKLWPNPQKFDPSRFLDGRGNAIKREELIPFSIGKRQCIGEGLAKMELFLYFVSMMQHFRFRLAPGHPVPDTRGVLALTHLPKPFKIIIEERHSDVL